MNKKTFEFTGYVRRRVVDEITIVIKADTEDEAYKEAWDALAIYPAPLEDGSNIPSIYIESRDSQDVEVIGLTPREEKSFA